MIEDITQVRELSKRTAFQAEETANTKVLRQEGAWSHSGNTSPV